MIDGPLMTVPSAVTPAIVSCQTFGHFRMFVDGAFEDIPNSRQAAFEEAFTYQYWTLLFLRVLDHSWFRASRCGIDCRLTGWHGIRNGTEKMQMAILNDS